VREADKKKSDNKKWKGMQYDLLSIGVERLRKQSCKKKKNVEMKLGKAAIGQHNKNFVRA